MARNAVFAICLLVLSDRAWAEEITGNVRFLGKLPPPQKFTLPDGSTLLHHDVVVDKHQGLRDVVAVLEDAPVQPKLVQAERVLMDQRDMVFVPRVIAVQHGTPVEFGNSDLHNHSVMAFSRRQTDQFNRFVTPGRPIEHTFAPQKHPVQIGCSLHGWMRAWIYVLPHPWFAVSDGQGKFSIAGVPPGKYSLWLRHADSGLEERRTVHVKRGKATELKVEWEKIAAK